MPELPEVESVRLGLADHLPGRTVVGVQVLHPRPVRDHLAGAEDFAHTLTGVRFTEPRRRGKFLWLPLADGDAVLAHLGMSGQFRVDDPDSPLLRNTRVIFDLDNGRQLRFVDQRMFGGLAISRGGADFPSEYGHVARDVFDPEFELNAVAAKMGTRRSAIKRVLLDQRLVSGFGNIYADEALWEARLHPERPADELSTRKLRELLRVGTGVMSSALAAGGTSFDSLYVHVNGESGYFDRSLQAYGREGEPCARCGTGIRRVAFTNRSSHFCPKCQRTS